MSVNSRWFRDRLQGKGLSQRQLAKKMGLDPSAISLMFRGEREMKMSEAPQIATLLGVPVRDVLENAGIKMDGSMRSVPLVGTIDGKGEAHLDWTGGGPRIAGPADLPEDAVAVQFRTLRSDWDIYDGWIAFTTPPTKGVPAECVSRLCFVGVEPGLTLMRFLRRGYMPGTYNLINFGVAGTQDTKLSWATPVFWLKPV